MVVFSSTAVVVGAGLVPFVPCGTVRFTGCAARGGVVAWRLTPPTNSMREINGVRKIFTLSQAWLVPGPERHVEAVARGFLRHVALWGRFLRRFGVWINFTTSGNFTWGEP